MSESPVQQPIPSRPPRLDLDSIQGDILTGFPKKTQMLYFFEITNPDAFKTHMKKFIPLVTSVADVQSDRQAISDHKKRAGFPGPQLLPVVGVNIGFSHFGLQKLDIPDENLVDTAFLRGQLADAPNLGDPGKTTDDGFDPDWDPAFKKQIHGVFVVAGESHTSVDRTVDRIKKIFDGDRPGQGSIRKITAVVGDVRPGAVSAHEHFGFLDGISNPSIIGFDKDTPPGPPPIRAGAILLGREGDLNQNVRDPWMVDGSFLVFRHLFQRVPEFNKFLDDNALIMPGHTKEEGKELLGARLVGRWKSGAPVDVTPFLDDPKLATNALKNNNFHFKGERDFQKICPMAAHVRKTLPRADLEARGISLERRRIMRRGIQFGPEVTRQEEREQRTIHGRGLVFICYQSSIVDGFQFIQQSWSNNKDFPPFEEAPETPGFDPIIGQGTGRKMSGFDPDDPTRELILPDDPWVVTRGGEYFFNPSIKGLKEKFAADD